LSLGRPGEGNRTDNVLLAFQRKNYLNLKHKIAERQRDPYELTAFVQLCKPQRGSVKPESSERTTSTSTAVSEWSKCVYSNLPPSSASISNSEARRSMYITLSHLIPLFPLLSVRFSVRNSARYRWGGAQRAPPQQSGAPLLSHCIRRNDSGRPASFPESTAAAPGLVRPAPPLDGTDPPLEGTLFPAENRAFWRLLGVRIPDRAGSENSGGNKGRKGGYRGRMRPV
jgi:hypothetical protein